MKKISFFVLMLFFCLNLGAVIIETDDLSTIFDYVDADSIVVFDLDHTVIANDVDLDTWLSKKISELQESGLSSKEAALCGLSQYFMYQHCIGCHPVGIDRPDVRMTHEVIADLQQLGVPVMALTNRSQPVIKRTLRELKDLHIDFSLTSLSKDTLSLLDTHSANYVKGIIFGGANDKGRILFDFLQAIECQPKKIIFIDDKLKYVQSVEKAAKEHDVAYVGIRFSLQDETKNSVDFDQIKRYLYATRMQIGLESMQRDLPEEIY